MSLDYTDSNADNPNTASVASAESLLMVSSVPGPSTSTHASPTSMPVGPSASAPANTSISAPACPSVSALGNPSVTASANPSIPTSVVDPSVSTPVDPFVSVPASPSAHENNHHSNTPPSNNKNVADQKQLNNNNTEDITQTAGRQQPTGRRHLLLGRRPAPVTGPADTYDYTQIFAEDEPYTELNPFARVWKVYNQEIAKLDSDRIEDWRDGLDSLLVFAALFSAVITTIVVQTSLSLQKDWGEVTANLLMELIMVQRAGLSGIPVNTIPISQLSPSSQFTPRSVDVAINSLWFFSLAVSLFTALAAILCKQWIHQYVIMSSTNSPRDEAHIHHFRFKGLDKWHVAGIIGLLPTFVHLSLGVFFGGLILFLHDLSPIIGGIVDVVIALTFVLYTIANLLPLWLIDCPYKTSLEYPD
ncbi:hypothetical protein K435DRAFT_969281 [Dendrothele bispora CBS 962.96]|uniref:DUF6535 domain-containing protein n=1 Tax=Dendrothele bispora (strain CBS 962.96) TaxID=1314807 RepID=A0A4S8LIP2_DENBC|nr:hypothetical protein K435DRAFT_969281 [Dendrothele bispora CBS 962.96]